MGSAAPIVVQSMTNTDTADADATALQVAALAHAGSELVRVTVNNDAAARAVPVDPPQARRPRGRRAARRRLPLQRAQAPDRAPGLRRAALAKYRINPGNVGSKRRDEHFVDDHPRRARARQARPHRGELGLARPGPPDDPDGRERPTARPARRARRDDRGDAPVRPALGRARRGDRPGPRPHHHQREGQRRGRPRRRSIASSRAAATIRSTSA